MRVPAAQQVIVSHKKPSVTTLSNGDIRIKHREFITDLTGSESFSVRSSCPIQPGMSSSFPWLSRLAANFESYKFESLSYHVTTMSSTATRGTLGVAIDYDASDPPPTTKVQALAMQNSVRGPAWQPDLVLRASPPALNKLKERFVRTATIPSTDIKMYDAGNLFVYADGFGTGTGVVAELHVEYVITLMTPQLGDLSAATNSASLLIATPLRPTEMNPVVRNMSDNESIFDIAATTADTTTHAGNLIRVRDPIFGGSTTYDDIIFDRPGRYQLVMSAARLFAGGGASQDWGFNFPAAWFGNPRGVLTDRGLGGSNGFTSTATLVFDVLRAGAILSMFSSGYSFRNLNRQIAINPVSSSWLPPMTLQLGGLVSRADGQDYYRIWCGPERPVRGLQNDTAQQTAAYAEPSERFKLEDTSVRKEYF